MTGRPPSRPWGELRPDHLYKGVGLLFLLALLVRYFDHVVEVFLLGYAAAILAVFFNAIVRRLPLERKWTTAGLGLVVLLMLGSALWFGVPLLLAQVRDLAGRAPEFQAQLLSVERWIRATTGLDLTLAGTAGRNLLTDTFLGGETTANILRQAQGVIGLLVVILLIIVGALYAVGQPNEQLLSPLLRAIPRSSRPAFRRIFQLLGDRLLGWMKGLLTSMAAVGLLSLLLYHLIGVPNALLLALIATLTEAIPVVGPWAGGAVAVGTAFVDDPTKGLWTAGAAIAIQQIEANLITPFAMARNARVHPFVTLFALLLFGSLFGFLGLLLSIPLVLLIGTVIEVLWIEGAIDTDQDSIPPVVQE